MKGNRNNRPTRKGYTSSWYRTNIGLLHTQQRSLWLIVTRSFVWIETVLLCHIGHNLANTPVAVASRDLIYSFERPSSVFLAPKYLKLRTVSCVALLTVMTVMSVRLHESTPIDNIMLFSMPYLCWFLLTARICAYCADFHAIFVGNCIEVCC